MKIILIALASIFFSLNNSAQDLGAVVEKTNHALGYNARLLIDQLESSGYFIFAGTEAKVPFKLIQAKPGKLRVETSVFGLKAIQTYNGKEAWTLNPMQSFEAEKTDARDMEFIASSAAINGPFSINKGEDFRLIYSGETEFKGINKQMVLYRSKEERLKFFINENTWLIDGIRYEYQKNGGWYSMEYAINSYVNYNGAMFPKEITAFINGIEMLSIFVNKIEEPSSLNEGIFDKPAY